MGGGGGEGEEVEYRKSNKIQALFIHIVEVKGLSCVAHPKKICMKRLNMC